MSDRDEVGSDAWYDSLAELEMNKLGLYKQRNGDWQRRAKVERPDPLPDDWKTGDPLPAGWRYEEGWGPVWEHDDLAAMGITPEQYGELLAKRIGQAAGFLPADDDGLLPTQPAGTRPAGERPRPLVDGLLTQGELLVLGAGRGVGKSWWGLDLAHQLARGTGKVMGTYTVRQAARVLYCHGELDPWAAYDRWQRLRGAQPLPPGLLESFERWRVQVIRRRVSSYDDDGRATSEETLDAILDGRLEATIVAERIEVLIIDPWAVFYSGRENSNDEAELALAELRRLQLTHGLTVIVLHHFGKADTARDPEDLWRGASRLADWASTRVTLLPFYKPDQARKIGLSRQQARQYANVKLLRRNAATPLDIAVKWNPETGQWDRWKAPEGEGDLLEGPSPADVASKCPVPDGWSSTVAAAAALGVSRDKARTLLEQAGQQGLLKAFVGPRGAIGWRVNGAAR